MRSALIVLLFIVGISTIHAQQRDMEVQDGILIGDTVKVNKRAGKYYNPKKAALRSAIIPGWGQIYNDSWWKVPLVYGGFGVALYYVDLNNDNFKYYKQEIAKEEAKTDPDENRLRIYARRADTWRNNRDLVVLTMIGLYGLQIIDATVDAHLKGFNVDENLALNLKPKFGVISDGTPFIGFKLTLPIGQ
ncbi:MAG: hypothetical protein HWE21_12875 [Cytophagia bacterium]|nr:hypothetical protein [Cytophagia bacterium]